jgi:dUTP pyrophosphatase
VPNEVIVQEKEKDTITEVPFELDIDFINSSRYPDPEKKTKLSSGFDLYCNEEAAITLTMGGGKVISTGIYVAIPEGYEIQIRPRSGLAAKHGITVLNSPGTIDADYRGEIKVILTTLYNTPVRINPGDRIAQAVVVPVAKDVNLRKVEKLSNTSRGEGGFGHTGIE